MKPSAFMVRVLSVIQKKHKEDSFQTPYWIASEVFPDDHPGWLRSCKCGAYGSTRGSGLIMFMGGYLGKLRKSDIVCEWYDTHDNRKMALTAKGQKILADNISLLDGEKQGDV